MIRLPIRGGNWNNTSNAGLAALNLSIERPNSSNTVVVSVPLFIKPEA